MGKRNRNRKPARKSGSKKPLPLFLIVCEGENTEPQYLQGFVRAIKNPRVQIEIANERGVPKTLVDIAKRLKKEAENKAKREKDENLAYDQVWAVFDVDEHPHIPAAVQMANANGIHLAITNPAFELWLLLHFRDSPGMKTRDDVRQLLKKHLPDYDKHVDYQKHYEAGYPDAVKRAKRLDKTRTDLNEEYHEHNPSTGVYKLTEAIRGPSL